MPEYVPNWWELILLALAAWRIFRLISEDDILDKPRRWVLNLDPDWNDGDEPNEEYRFKWGEFITCPYCAGFWISVAWWGAWLLFPDEALIAAVPFAISTIVIFIAKLDGIPIPEPPAEEE